jgi:hypothetical protein
LVNLKIIKIAKSVAIWDQPMRVQLIPNKGFRWDKLLSRNTKFIPKSEQHPEKLSPLGSTPLLFFLNLKIQK